MANYAVEVKDLGKTYPRVKAVNEVSFNIEDSEAFRLLGPNRVGGN